MMDAKVATWLLSHDTGASSKAIVAFMEGAREGCFPFPYDPDDLGRCVRLLKIAPQYRARLFEMRLCSEEWALLVRNWDKLESLYEQELPKKRAPKTYKLMLKLRKQAEKIRNVRAAKLERNDGQSE